MEYCRGLQFEQDPDYNFLIGLMESCLRNLNNIQKIQSGNLTKFDDPLKIKIRLFKCAEIATD